MTLLLALALASPSDTVFATRVAAAPTLDGVLDEAAWDAAAVVSGFIQRAPRDGMPAGERTEIRLLYTTSTLFVGVKAYDSRPDRIVATVMRRDDDALLENDQFAMAIDSYADGRNGYWFSTNPLGARSDYQFVDEGSQWIDWNGDWQVSASRTAEGWSAEIAIPFATLRFRPDSVVVMGMNFFRRIIRLNEQSFSPHIPLQHPEGTATVSLARPVAFVGITGGSIGFMRPYLLADVQRQFVGVGPEQTTQRVAFGVDARVNVTDNVTATVSYNTDFAQVEVDDRQLNLTRFDLFFPEKREFFLENGGLFTFGIPQEVDVFFSRRIGLTADSAGIQRTVPILLGAKVVARAGILELGLLDVVTEGLGPVPATNFGVLRAKAGIAPRSYVGAHVTTTHAEGRGEGTTGFDLNLYVTGATGIRGFAARTWGQAASGPGVPSAFGTELFHAGRNLVMSGSVLEARPGFQPAMGFIARPGTRRLRGNLGIAVYPASGSIRRIEPSVDVQDHQVVGGGLQTRSAAAAIAVDFRSEDRIVLTVTPSREVVGSAFPVFRNELVSAGDYTAVVAGLSLATKPGRPLSFTASTTHGGFFGGRLTELQTGVVWKQSRRLTVSPSYRLAVMRSASADFTAWTGQMRADFSWNTRFSAIGIAQYDNDSQRMDFSLRTVYQLREGTDLYVVLNHRAEDPGVRGRLLGAPLEQAAVIKAAYRFNF